MKKVVPGTMVHRLSTRRFDNRRIMSRHTIIQSINVLIATSLLFIAISEGLYAQTTSKAESVRELEAAQQKIQQVESDFIEALYTVARVQARLGHREDAYLALDRALGAGFNDVGRLRSDDAFQEFRSEALFNSLVQRARRNANIQAWENPEREAVKKSDQIIKALAFKPGERVADIGAGSGCFSFPVGEAVGSTGTVWALDISPEMIEHIDFRVQARKAVNVKPRRVLPDDPQLQPGSIDTILMFFTLHYVKDRVVYGKKLKEALAQGGRLVVISYITSMFNKEQLDQEMKAAGFKVQTSYDFLLKHFFVIYVPE
jgi:precorrin-6B methylase 2